MGFRKNRKVSEIPADELKQIKKKEADYRKRKKTGNVAGRVAKEVGRPLSSQEKLQIAMGERQRKFIKYFYQYNGNIAASCTATGISRSTFNSWMYKFPEMKEQITEVNEAMLDLAEQQLLKNISDGKEQSLFFFLCNKGKHRGWQDVRKLSAPRLQGIKINISHPNEPKRIPHIDVKAVDSGVVDG